MRVVEGRYLWERIEKGRGLRYRRGQLLTGRVDWGPQSQATGVTYGFLALCNWPI